MRSADTTRQLEFTQWGAFSPRRTAQQVAVMQNRAQVDQRMSDAELLALVSAAHEQIEVHGGVNESNLHLRDFAGELLTKRLWMMKLIRP
jgi:hypothetical protein